MEDLQENDSISIVSTGTPWMATNPPARKPASSVQSCLKHKTKASQGKVMAQMARRPIAMAIDAYLG